MNVLCVQTQLVFEEQPAPDFEVQQDQDRQEYDKRRMALIALVADEKKRDGGCHYRKKVKQVMNKISGKTTKSQTDKNKYFFDIFFHFKILEWFYLSLIEIRLIIANMTATIQNRTTIFGSPMPRC